MGNEPGRHIGKASMVSAHRANRVEEAHIRAASSGVVKAAIGLRADHEPPAAGRSFQEDHHVSDRRVALRPVGIFPKEEVTGAKRSPQVEGIRSASGIGRNRPEKPLFLQAAELVGGGPPEIFPRQAQKEVADRIGAVHHPRAGASFREPSGAVSDAASRQAANLLKDKMLRRGRFAALGGCGKRGRGRSRVCLGGRQSEDQKKGETQWAAPHSRRDLPEVPAREKKNRARTASGMGFDNDWTGGHTKGKPFCGSASPVPEIAKLGALA